MILFVDETECEDYFIVAGLLTVSKDMTDMTYKRFKKKIKTMKLSEKTKQQIFLEFKGVLLDRHYQKIKIKMLKELNDMKYNVYFASYIKKDKSFKQEDKEKQYILLLSKIVNSIDQDISIIFDTFNKPDFEDNIINTIKLHSNVLSIIPCDSRNEPGLQFVDNLCSVIRLNKSKKENDFYSLIENNIIGV